MNIYVGNISFKATEEDMTELFSEFGEVLSARIMTDRETGRSRGFGFVEMSEAEEGQSAIQNLDNTEWMGRTIVVNMAKKQ